MKSLLLLLCAIALCATAQPAFVWSGPSVIRQDARFSLTVTLTGNVAGTAASFDVTIPDDTTLIATTTGDAAKASGKALRCQATGPRLRCLIFGVNTTVIANGPQALLTFVTTANPADVTFGMIFAQGVDTTSPDFPFFTIAQAGPFKTTILARCDFDGDKFLNAADVTSFADQIIGRTAPTRCDLNGTASCDLIDLAFAISAAVTGQCTATTRGEGSLQL